MDLNGNPFDFTVIGIDRDRDSDEDSVAERCHDYAALVLQDAKKKALHIVGHGILNDPFNSTVDLTDPTHELQCSLVKTGA